MRLMCCVNVIVTGSLEIGAAHDASVVGADEPPTAPPAAAVEPGLAAFTCSGVGSAYAPLTSLPVLVVLGSAMESIASPAVETTLAVVSGRVVAVHARRERAERGRGAQRQRQRRRHGAADTPPLVLVASRTR